MKLLPLAALCLSLPTVALSQTFRAENHLTVVPLSASEFEVIESRGEGASGIWCAAADYAQSRLPKRDGRLYVKRPRAASGNVQGRKSVIFTNARDQLSVQPTTALSVSVKQVGYSLPVAHAIQFCRDDEDDRDDLIFPIRP